MPKKKTSAARKWYVWALALPAYAAAAAALGWFFAQSWSGWLVLGVAPVLLFDRLTLRLFAPADFDSRPVQLGIRGAYFLLGSFGFLLYFDGRISNLEAHFLGVVVTLFTFLMEFALEWGYWLYSYLRRSDGELKVRFLGVVVLGLVVALPLVVLHPLLIVHPVRRVAQSTPAHVGLRFENVAFRTADGLKLEGWFVPAESPRATVVYCHGYGENRGQSLMLLEDLHKMKLNVLAFDFRGHGTSGGHTVTFGHREVEDIKAACEEARRLGKDAPVLLVGVSYGAGVALQSLSEVPFVAGVWADSTFTQLDDIVGKSFDFVPPDGKRALVSVINAMVRLDCGFWPSRVNTIDALRGMNTPIFFCHGKNDSDTPFDEARRVYEAYSGPKGHYWVDDDSETALSALSKRDYARRMRAFFDKALELKTSVPAESERQEL